MGQLASYSLLKKLVLFPRHDICWRVARANAQAVDPDLGKSPQCRPLACVDIYFQQFKYALYP